MYLTHAAVTVLSAGIVLDKSKIAALNAVDLSALMKDAYSSGNEVVVVDNASLFFTAARLFKEIEEPTNPIYWGLIAEKLGVNITSYEIYILSSAIGIRQRIKESLKPEYKFAPVPDVFNVETSLTLVRSGQAVRRTNDTYQISLVQLMKIWTMASRRWMKLTNEESLSVRCEGTDRRARIGVDTVVIGCQTIHRYELEQFAVKMNWDFPKP